MMVMMKRLAWILILVSTAAAAQTGTVQGYCDQGATSALVQGLASTNPLQGIIPSCLITVYLTGTTNLATIYADGSNTPLANPFTASSKGAWLFWAATSQGYDVVLSGGIAPNNYPSPVTKTNLTPSIGIIPYPGQVCNVASYGAVGDGTTNDHAAIQAAEDACYANGGSLYFPTRWGAVGQTVYYTATPIIFKGVSMFGPPGASGPFATYLTQSAVAIQGAAGQDVFNVPDPASGGYVTPRFSYTVQDLAIFVDVSSDASGNHLNRKPGRTVMDAVANGTTVVTSATAKFQPGDVGQTIKVGSTTTTIASVQSATQATLAATVTTGSNLTAYISAMGLSATATIGNCGFCYDDSTGIGTAISKSVFRDVIIRDVNGTDYANNASGFFFQGNASPTWTRWENVSVAGLTYGFSFVPVSAVAPTASIYAGIADYNLWDHVFIGATYPFLAYSGELQEIKGMQIYSGFGPQLINAYGQVSNTSNWKIDIPEQEAQSCPSGQSWRIAGIQHEISRLSIGMCAGATIQWDASDSTVSGFGTGAYASTFNVTGNLNHFNYPQGADLLNAYLTLNNTGFGNTLTSGTLFNPFGAQQPARAQYANPGLSGLATSPLWNPGLSRGSIYLNRTSDFINKGSSAYFFNGEDLWLWPQEVQDSGRWWDD